MKGTPAQAMAILNAATRCGTCYGTDVIVLGVESTTMGSLVPGTDWNRHTYGLLCSSCGNRWERTFYPHGTMADGRNRETLDRPGIASVEANLREGRPWWWTGVVGREEYLLSNLRVMEEDGAPVPIPVPALNRPGE